MSAIAKPGRYKAPNGEVVPAMRWDGTPDCEHAMWIWTAGKCHWQSKRRAFGFQDGIMIRHCGIGDWIVLRNGFLGIEPAESFEAGYTELPYEDQQPHVTQP